MKTLNDLTDEYLNEIIDYINKTGRISASKTFEYFNFLYDKNENVTTCASCVKNKRLLIKSWLLNNKVNINNNNNNNKDMKKPEAITTELPEIKNENTVLDNNTDNTSDVNNDELQEILDDISKHTKESKLDLINYVKQQYFVGYFNLTYNAVTNSYLRSHKSLIQEWADKLKKYDYFK